MKKKELELIYRFVSLEEPVLEHLVKKPDFIPRPDDTIIFRLRRYFVLDVLYKVSENSVLVLCQSKY